MDRMATISPEQPIVTLMVPAEYVEYFRRAVVRAINKDSKYYKKLDDEAGEAGEYTVFAEKAAGLREDRDGMLRSLRASAEILNQLPDDEISCHVSAEPGELRYLLDGVGKLWAGQVRGRFQYGPADIEALPELMERMRWLTEQVSITGVH
jgi:hypothetical protein